jgi:hypothetical protein
VAALPNEEMQLTDRGFLVGAPAADDRRRPAIFIESRSAADLRCSPCLGRGSVRRRALGIIVAVLAGGTALAGGDRAITSLGIGPVRVGMTPAQASKARGEPLVPAAGMAGSDTCELMHFATNPTLLFMVEAGHVVRVETADASYHTSSGVAVGDTEEHALQRYRGGVETAVHHYNEKGHYLTVRSKDKRSAVVLETDGTRVVYIRAGRVPAAEYVERCL